MRIKSIVSMVAALFLILVGCSRAFDYPEAKVTVKVMDELSQPIENVEVLIGFQEPKLGEQGTKEIAIKGITKADGVFSASRKTCSQIAYSAKKQGYYNSRGDYHFSTSANGQWQPWNPEFRVVLRKIENPVPMYARDTKMSPLPLLKPSKELGFDLIEYDWVVPYGKGKHADFIYKTQVSYKNENEYSYKLILTFPGKFDGIQLVKEDLNSGSQLKLPRIAPSSGYSNKLIKSRSKLPNQALEDNYQSDNNYIFRIRSEEKDGKLVKAMYGKIQGDIGFGIKSSGESAIIFKYYLNPDFTTNLEFNPQQNLFRNLKSMERVGLE